MSVLSITDPHFPLYPERAADLFDRDHGWLEDSEQQASGEIVINSDGSSHASMRGEVEPNQFRSFALYALGYAYADDPAVTPGSYRLRRVNPPTHPKAPFLRAKGFSWHEWCPQGGTVPGTVPVSPANTYPSPGDVPVGYPLKLRSLFPRIPGQNFGGGAATAYDRKFVPFSDYYTRFTRARVTVEFFQPRYTLVEDDDPAFVANGYPEHARNVYWTTEPSVDLIALEGGTNGQLFWRERSDTGPTIATNIPTANVNQPTAGSGFPAPLGYIDPKLMDVANWIQVPQRYIFDSNLIPTKILTCLGKTNKYDWLGYPAGTALLMGASFEPFAWPVYCTAYDLPFLWNVKYHFKYHNPTRAETITEPDPAPTARLGWKIFRWQDSFSYWATRFNGDDLYGEVDFAKLFEHREKP